MRGWGKLVVWNRRLKCDVKIIGRFPLFDLGMDLLSPVESTRVLIPIGPFGHINMSAILSSCVLHF